MTTLFHGVVRDGKVDWSDRKGIAAHMAELEGVRVVVSVEPLRGLDANALYHKVKAAAAKATGNSVRKIHDAWKREFLIPVNGQYTTRYLSRDQFTDYLLQCTAEALEYGAELDELQGRLPASRKGKGRAA